ncbi:MAG TPA: SDR family oxidoreductase [Xanthobacteraceae bacterium]|nr:SDR family oxidoreductase [Xanthobacteraceae bacterium]
MDLGIAGCKAIVCASSKGLGRACAEKLAEAECEVVVNGRNRDSAEATAAEIRKATGTKAVAVAADVASPEGQAALFTACPDPDILVTNNLGPPPRDYHDVSRQQILDGVVGSMVTPIELIQRAIDSMVAKKFGRIVNITSGGVYMPQVNLEVSCGARAGLTAFLATVARAVAPHNVTINFLLPGAFETDRLRAIFETAAKRDNTTPQAARAQRVASIPAKRVGKPEEFGAACAFLCSAHAGFITGHNLLIDGGAFPAAFA